MDRSSQEDREREWARLNLKKGGENGPELCHEVERVKEKGDETIPKKAVRQREQEHKKEEKYLKYFTRGLENFPN